MRKKNICAQFEQNIFDRSESIVDKYAANEIKQQCERKCQNDLKLTK